MKENISMLRIDKLYNRIKTVIDTAQQNIVRVVNENMLTTYWSIGLLIVEDEQGGEARAEYGKRIIKELSQRLTAEYGKGYSVSNLQYFRQFFLYQFQFTTRVVFLYQLQFTTRVVNYLLTRL